MKKKLALLLSAIMVATMVPASAFAITTNEINRIVTDKVDGVISTTDPVVLTIKDKNLNDANGSQTFKVTLENAVWPENVSDLTSSIQVAGGAKIESAVKITDQQAMITFNTELNTNSIKISLAGVVLKGEGDATVTIDPMNSVISGGTYKIANVVAGATTTTVEKKVDIVETGSEIKSIIITETTPGSIKKGTDIRVKLSNGFTFDGEPVVTAYPNTANITGKKLTSGREELNFQIGAESTSSTGVYTITISGANVKFDSDEVDFGSIAEVTVSGADITKTTLEVGTAVDYGVSLTAESKTLPTFIAGRSGGSEQESLKVTFKETVKGSWLESRKTTFTLPAGVKVDMAEGEEISLSTNKGGLTVKGTVSHKSDYSVVTITGTGDRSGTVELGFKLPLTIDPTFTGDVVATLGGAGVSEDMEVTIATVVAPVTVTAETNEVSIDYRNVAIGDIVITETEAGNLEKGKTLYVQLEDIAFDGTPVLEVVEGDIKIDSVKVNKGLVEINVKTASQKTPAVLKLTSLELYLDRTLPAGSYKLSLVQPSNSSNTTDAIFKNNISTNVTATGNPLFDTSEIVVLKDFVEVVTAGRDQDDSTFTTTISVVIGADTMMAGKTSIALDVPAYISGGYTMLPVRAVTEALSGSAIVRWDDASRTVTITFGSRVISMTVGSSSMNINGVPVQMSKACEITDSRAFIPLRDLGYALGLNDSKINWDAATNTATLN